MVVTPPNHPAGVTGAFRARWSYSNATVRNLQTKVILDKRIKEKSLNLISLRVNLSSIKFCLLVGRWNISRDGFALSYSQTTPIKPHSPKTDPAPLGFSTIGGCLFNQFVYRLHILQGVCLRSVSSVLYAACTNYPIGR